MKLIPHQNITYRTQLTLEQVQQRLTDNMRENTNMVFIKTKGVSLFGKKQHKALQGKALPQSFTASRMPSYHSPTLPIAHGTVMQHTSAGTAPTTEIQVSMQVQPMLLIGGGIFVFMLLNMIGMFAKTNTKFVIILLIVALVIFVPVYCFIVYVFHQEVAKLDDFLLQTLQATRQ